MRGGGKGSSGTARPPAGAEAAAAGGLRGGGKSASVSCLLRGSVARSSLAPSWKESTGLQDAAAEAERPRVAHPLTG